MQLGEQSFFLVLVLWVLGCVGSQRGPEVTLFWWDVVGMSWRRLRPKVALTFCHLRLSTLRHSVTSQRKILEGGRALPRPPHPAPGRMNGLKKHFPPLHSLVKFHSGLTKRNPGNYHFPSGVSTSWHQPVTASRSAGEPGPSSCCPAGCGGLGVALLTLPSSGHQARGREAAALEMAFLPWVSGLDLVILVRRTCPVGCAAWHISLVVPLLCCLSGDHVFPVEQRSGVNWEVTKPPCPAPGQDQPPLSTNTVGLP